jgi:hypothetical protein
MHWFKWTYFHELALYFWSATIKVMALLMLQATRTSVSLTAGSGGFVLRCWVETDCGTNDSAARGKEPKGVGLRHLAYWD